LGSPEFLIAVKTLQYLSSTFNANLFVEWSLGFISMKRKLFKLPFYTLGWSEDPEYVPFPGQNHSQSVYMAETSAVKCGSTENHGDCPATEAKHGFFPNSAKSSGKVAG
jgi:hypothetical protein